MQVFRRKSFRPGAMIASVAAATVLAIGLLAGCGGGGSGNNTDDTRPTDQTGTVTGVLVAPDGVTPIAGGLVYAPRNRSAAKATRLTTPPEAYYSSTTTGANGAFTLNDVPVGNTEIRFLKGQFSLTQTVQVRASQTTTLPRATTTLPGTGTGAPKIAVVTGDYDTIEDVLAKLGLGRIDSVGRLVPGTQKFTIYNGGGSAPSGSQPQSALFTSAATMAQYKIIFVNCGADEDLLDRADVRTNIRNFINNGGSFFASDYAYDFIESAFPAAIDFFGETALPPPPSGDPDSMIEDRDAAQVTSGDSEGTVMDTAMKNWLQGRGALNSAGKVPFEDYYTIIDAVPSTTKVWLQAPIDYPMIFSPDRMTATGRRHSHSHGAAAATSRATVVKPQTVTFDQGQGRALFTTFHTVSQPAVALRPQEQILAYLVFEL